MAPATASTARALTARCLHASAAVPSSSAARSYVRLAATRSRTTDVLPDFLLPRRVLGRSMAFTSMPTTHTQRVTFTAVSPARIEAAAAAANSPASVDMPAGVAAGPETKVVQNPQEDEEGKLMLVEITAGASKRLREIMVKDQNPNLALRIQVESGGCHGFQYLMSLTTLPSAEAPTGADQAAEEDIIFEADGAKIVMDLPSLELLKGSKVDFTTELIGSQFQIVDNPFAVSSCGCGTSFDIKI